jgi:integrase
VVQEAVVDGGGDDAIAEDLAPGAETLVPNVRIHELKHTFGRRLRAAGVAEEARAVLLGHKTRSMPMHYSVAELAELLAAVNRIDRSLAMSAITLLRAAA